eukprot:TRINITY_DN22135_c0_g1_i1.p1 TRINITY_DN22135_c0_g1~~TRINITY_DN22135_c0_g1_i1.p1  ORF type:complete len:298 (+),score=70.15 TRINITY_DN22135_c0_g1_i1:218-1111(+)
MSSSREGSPDWLRCFQAPNRSFVTLSSGSDSSPNRNPTREEDINLKESSVHLTSKSPERNHNEDAVFVDSEEESLVNNKAPKSKAGKIRKKADEHNLKEGDSYEGEVAKEGTLEKHAERHVSSKLPLVLPEKVHRSKALVECDGESIDLTGDMGAVGRVIISNAPSGNQEMLLDLKGTIYKTTIVPSRTFCIVSFGQTEAKIEAIMNDFVQLKPHSNVYEAETVVEGTLDGFSFDQEEDGEKMTKGSAHQSDQNNGNDDPTNAKANMKGVIQKKRKATGKPPKKGGKKSQIMKKVKK